MENALLKARSLERGRFVDGPATAHGVRWGVIQTTDTDWDMTLLRRLCALPAPRSAVLRPHETSPLQIFAPPTLSVAVAGDRSDVDTAVVTQTQAVYRLTRETFAETDNVRVLFKPDKFELQSYARVVLLGHGVNFRCDASTVAFVWFHTCDARATLAALGHSSRLLEDMVTVRPPPDYRRVEVSAAPAVLPLPELRMRDLPAMIKSVPPFVWIATVASLGCVVMASVGQRDCCPVCLSETPKQPTRLPCGHVLCLACLVQWWESNDKCTCPSCRKDHSDRPMRKLHIAHPDPTTWTPTTRSILEKLRDDGGVVYLYTETPRHNLRRDFRCWPADSHILPPGGIARHYVLQSWAVAHTKDVWTRLLHGAHTEGGGSVVLHCI